MYASTYFDTHVITLLNQGGIGVGPTDTIYGLLARADNKKLWSVYIR
jgi:tRNA A37 threonylcarbamoyladenosine synthetase subunit TsaC/SUA5/YrdC